MTTLTLYSFRRCPFAMRVRFTLHEKGIPFVLKEEDLKHFSPELRALHPEAKVPLLVHGTLVLYESSIITEYLEEAFPEPPLLPPKTTGNAEARAQVRLLTYWCNQLFKRDVDRVKYGTSRFSEAECVGVEDRLRGHLDKLEHCLKETPWLVGDRFSLADIHLYPFCRQLFAIKTLPDGIAVPPTGIATWMERVSARDAFRKTLEA